MMLNKKRTTLHIKVGNITRPVARELSLEGAADDNSCGSPKDKQEEELDWWYMSRKEIIEHSPSRKDGIDWKKETSYRNSYCTFLQDFGMRLKVPQITIATAIVFCHRFFLRQSHAKNDRWTIATACMFLAGKVEETPRPLKEVIRISSEIIHKNDPTAVLRIKQKEVYQQRKELILLGERVVLITLGFAFHVQHPYKPLIEAIKKFNIAKHQLAQVAWNFVNDGLRTSLCLQFKPHQIAAGAIFLAAKFLKVKLPSDGEKVWWQELDVTACQLEEVSNQMLELYEQNRVPTSEGSEVEGSARGGTGATAKARAVNEEKASTQVSSHSSPKHTSAKNLEVQLRGVGNQRNDERADVGSDITDQNADLDIRDGQNSEQLPQKDNEEEVSNRSNAGTEGVSVGDQDRTGGKIEAVELRSKDDLASNKSSCNVDWHLELREGLLCHSPNDVMKMVDKNKVKAALEKRRKERGKMAVKKDIMDEDDLIERELEDGIELAVEDEKNKERRWSWSSPDCADNDEDHDETRDAKHKGIKGHLLEYMNADNAEEGKMIDDASSSSNDQKSKVGSPPARQPAVKKVA